MAANKLHHRSQNVRLEGQTKMSGARLLLIVLNILFGVFLTSMVMSILNLLELTYLSASIL
jgi:hypothetical protein